MANLFGLGFHGAFRNKSDAEKRASEHKDAFIIRKFVGRSASSLRYIVCTPAGTSSGKKRAAKKRTTKRGGGRRRSAATSFNPWEL